MVHWDTMVHWVISDTYKMLVRSVGGPETWAFDVWPRTDRTVFLITIHHPEIQRKLEMCRKILGILDSATFTLVSIVSCIHNIYAEIEISYHLTFLQTWICNHNKLSVVIIINLPPLSPCVNITGLCWRRTTHQFCRCWINVTTRTMSHVYISMIQS